MPYRLVKIDNDTFERVHESDPERLKISDVNAQIRELRAELQAIQNNNR